MNENVVQKYRMSRLGPGLTRAEDRETEGRKSHIKLGLEISQQASITGHETRDCQVSLLLCEFPLQRNVFLYLCQDFLSL